jgi:UDP-N-acetylglucosamine 3-dehydrogenase
VLRVGLVGAGALGSVHAANLPRIPGCRLSAVAYDLSREPAERLARASGAAVVAPSAIVDPELVDALVVATPTDTHAEYVLRAIDADIPVFCEKPLARTCEEARQIADHAALRFAKVAVGHVVRYFPEYVHARELVRSGALGTPSIARLARLNASPARTTAWYAETARSGGALLDMAIHDVDWSLWTFGAATRVFAVTAGAVGAEVVSITLRHASGSISYLDTSWRETCFSTRLEVAGTTGVYSARGSGSAGFDSVQQGTDTYLPPSADMPLADDPFLLELQAAMDWFRGGPPPRATVSDACEAIRVVEAARESIETGAPVALHAHEPVAATEES